MSISRRDAIKLGAVAGAYAALGSSALALASDPALGLIFPPLNYPIPPDARRLYPKGVELRPLVHDSGAEVQRRFR